MVGEGGAAVKKFPISDLELEYRLQQLGPRESTLVRTLYHKANGRMNIDECMDSLDILKFIDEEKININNATKGIIKEYEKKKRHPNNKK